MNGFDRRLEAFQARLGHQFSDRDLLVRALTHSSYGDGRRVIPDNERLEFLGDRVLGLLTAEKLFHDGNESEGKLARRLNALVRKETCADIARKLEFSEVLRLSKSEVKQGGADKASILGDACEAVIAAIYLDGGLDAVRAFYARNWTDLVTEFQASNTKDPKTELQEKAVKFGFDQPNYEVVGREGPDHRPEFAVKVEIVNFGEEVARAANKKNAEREAAKALLLRLKAKHGR